MNSPQPFAEVATCSEILNDLNHPWPFMEGHGSDTPLVMQDSPSLLPDFLGGIFITLHTSPVVDFTISNNHPIL